MQNPKNQAFAIISMIAMLASGTVYTYSQSSCPKPTTYSTTCSGSCTVSGGTCSYTTTFQTSFTGNKKYAKITIFANGNQVHEQCIGPMASGTKTYAVSYTAPCNTAITGWYIAYTNSSTQNPCGGTTCDEGSCSGSSCGSFLLPITLVSFNARSIDHSIILEWKTSSEIDNDHFRIERSREGIDWEILDIVSGAGNSNIGNSYSLVDAFPYRGMNYYRLIQVDQDGTENIFKIVAQESGSPDKPFLLLDHGKTLLISDNLEETVRIVVTDLQGRPLQTRIARPGSATVFEDLIAGIYIVHLRSSEITASEKLLVSY